MPKLLAIACQVFDHTLSQLFRSLSLRKPIFDRPILPICFDPLQMPLSKL